MITASEMSATEIAKYAKLLKESSKDDNSRVSFASTDFTLKGFVNAVCREAPTKKQLNNGDLGEIAWEIHQPNLITDLGRRFWLFNGFSTAYVTTSPSQNTPNPARYSVADSGDLGSMSQSYNIAPSINWSTLTKTYSTTFGTPTGNRRVGTIGLSSAINSYINYPFFYAYSLIVPLKIQTTTQTIELAYNITLSPVS